MGLIGSIGIGMSADYGGFNKDINKAIGAINKIAGAAGAAQQKIGGRDSGGVASAASNLTGMFAKPGAAAVAIGAGIAVWKGGEFLVDSVKKASDLNETLSKTKTVFGESAEVLISAADRMAAKFGTAK